MPALVGQERVAIDSDGQAAVAGVYRGAAGQEGDRQGRAAVVGQSAQARVGDADLVAVGAVGQPGGSAGADQVVRAGHRPQAADVVGRCAGACAVGILGDDRVVENGRAIRVDKQPAAGVTEADVIADDGAVDDRERA